MYSQHLFRHFRSSFQSRLHKSLPAISRASSVHTAATVHVLRGCVELQGEGSHLRLHSSEHLYYEKGALPHLQDSLSVGRKHQNSVKVEAAAPEREKGAVWLLEIA